MSAWEPRPSAARRLAKSVALRNAMVALVLLGVCMGGPWWLLRAVFGHETVDPSAARRPTLVARTVPEDAGPTTIPAAFKLPGEVPPRSQNGSWGVDGTAFNQVNWPFDPCARPEGPLIDMGASAEQRSIYGRLPGGADERHYLAVFPDTGAATALMAELRRSLMQCYAGEASVWEARDLPDVGDDALQAASRAEWRNMALQLIRSRGSYVVMQVRNAVVVVLARADGDAPAVDEARLRQVAAEAVEALHRVGWPR